ATAAASLSQHATTTAFAPISEQERREGLVFILSSPRSGSTLLRAMLAGHARLFAPPELHLLPFSTMRQREEALGSTHLGEGLQRAIMELLGADADAAREVLREMVVDDYPIHRVYAWLLDHAGGRLLVDKSPTYGLELSTLHRAEALFAHARYVHLVRHPQAVTESFARMRLHKLFPEVVGSAEQVGEHVWYVTNANIGQFLSTVDTARHLRLRYEDLVGDPAAQIAAICATLDLAPEAAMLDPYDGDRMRDGVHSHSLPIGDPNFNRHDRIDHTLAEHWRDRASGRAFSPPSVTLAQQLGYALTVEATADAAGDASASDLAPALRAQAIEHTYRSGGYALRVSEWGPRSGPAVVCVHGAMEHGHSWQWLAAHLAAAGMRVLAPDLRGHGLSEHQRRGNALSIHDWLLDLDALLEDFDLRQVQLVGHSMGTLLTSTLAALRPERIGGLTLIEPILPGITDLPSRLGRLLREGRERPEPVVFDSREAAVERLRGANPALEPAEADALAERSLTRTEQGWHWRWDPRLSTRTFAVDADREEYLALLGSLRLPVTIVRGHDSPFGRQSDVDAWSGALRQAQTYLMDGAHHPHVRCADRVARLVLAQQQQAARAAAPASWPARQDEPGMRT
ncbi:MAG TPA: alpha/beta fold hydrolase, partial [Kofleriaceae bacterium]|nr:alpha/beta fold hydrolase [Kofleriaceae bacterium]